MWTQISGAHLPAGPSAASSAVYGTDTASSGGCLLSPQPLNQVRGLSACLAAKFEISRPFAWSPCSNVHCSVCLRSIENCCTLLSLLSWMHKICADLVSLHAGDELHYNMNLFPTAILNTVMQLFVTPLPWFVSLRFYCGRSVAAVL